MINFRQYTEQEVKENLIYLELNEFEKMTLPLRILRRTPNFRQSYIKSICRNYREKNVERCKKSSRESSKRYYLRNKEKIKEWHRQNRAKLREKERQRYQKRKLDPEFMDKKRKYEREYKRKLKLKNSSKNA